MNSLPVGTWWHFSLHQTTVGSSIMQGEWRGGYISQPKPNPDSVSLLCFLVCVANPWRPPHLRGILCRAMMSVDDTLMCSFQILKPAEKRQRSVISRWVGLVWFGLVGWLVLSCYIYWEEKEEESYIAHAIYWTLNVCAVSFLHHFWFFVGSAML